MDNWLANLGTNASEAAASVRNTSESARSEIEQTAFFVRVAAIIVAVYYARELWK